MSEELEIRHCFERLRDDEWIDEIRLVIPGKSLRLATFPRFKTSGLSGDEWRTSVAWQFMTEDGWETFDGGYSTLDVGCAALFPGLYTSHGDRHRDEVEGVEFFRKGRKLWGADYEGESLPLLIAAGHIPWALVRCGDQPTGFDGWEKKCFQPGCSENAVSTYRLKKRFDRRGKESPSTREWKHGSRPHLSWDARRFCVRHLRRGDCGLDDADRNYEVVEGLGPDGHETRGGDIAESVLAGVVGVKLS